MRGVRSQVALLNLSDEVVLESAKNLRLCTSSQDTLDSGSHDRSSFERVRSLVDEKQEQSIVTFDGGVLARNPRILEGAFKLSSQLCQQHVAVHVVACFIHLFFQLLGVLFFIEIHKKPRLLEHFLHCVVCFFTSWEDSSLALLVLNDIPSKFLSSKVERDADASLIQVVGHCGSRTLLAFGDNLHESVGRVVDTFGQVAFCQKRTSTSRRRRCTLESLQQTPCQSVSESTQEVEEHVHVLVVSSKIQIDSNLVDAPDTDSFQSSCQFVAVDLFLQLVQVQRKQQIVV